MSILNTIHIYKACELEITLLDFQIPVVYSLICVEHRIIIGFYVNLIYISECGLRCFEVYSVNASAIL